MKHGDVLVVVIPDGMTVAAYPLNDNPGPADWVVVFSNISIEAWSQLSEATRKVLVADALKRAGYVSERETEANDV